MPQLRARSKKRGSPSVTSKKVQERDGQLKTPVLDMALIEENEWLKCQQERFRGVRAYG